ncbi:MAG: response regulator [Lachnospiraceae bacterium]|nr:response regulator [Lachnospiraceae bacterium]
MPSHGPEGMPGGGPLGGPPEGRPADEAALRKRSRVFMIEMMILSSLCCGTYSALIGRLSFTDDPVASVVGFLLLFSLPLMFIGSVYNFPMGALCFFAVEISGMVFYFDRLYSLSYQLLALFSVNVFMQKGIYKSVRKSALMSIISGGLHGLLLFVLWEISLDRTFDQWNLQVLPLALVIAMTERFFSYFYLYAFFRFLPPKLLVFFPPGKFYHEFRPDTRGMGFSEGGGPSALGQRMGRYMIAEGILVGLGITLFVNALLPGIQPSRAQQIIFVIKVTMCVFVESVPIVVAVNFIMHGRVINPLRNMTRGMKAFAGQDERRKEAEQYIAGLKIKTGDELETLYGAMTEMVGEVNRYIRRIEEEQKLKEELQVAQAASEAKSNFLSHMSHEIRTPINAVIGMDEMIIRESRESNVLHYAKDIRNAGRSLLSIVNDILDFSRIEAGKMEIIPEDYELSTVLYDVTSMIMPKAREKQLDFKVDVDKRIPRRLRGDEMRLKQCILNLLSNAVKYTQIGKVRLKLGYSVLGEDEILLSVQVSDTGIGIRAEDLKKLINPFERIDEERNRTIEGTGLGMSITANLLKLMDSKLEVQSEYGRGSVFSFRLKQEVAGEEPIGDFAKRYEELLSREQKYHEKFHAPDARILVVDDTKTNLTVIRGLLRETGINVDTVTSGKEMLDAVVRQYYDMIFLDQRMPVMDGIEALHLMEMLAERKNPDAPVVALTANAISGAREMFLSEGFRDYLSKPVDYSKLENMLIRYLPKDKIILSGEEGFDESGRQSDVSDKASVSEGEPDEISLLSERIRNTEGIDYNAAIARCMKDDILIETLRDFRISAAIAPGEIEKCLSEGNIKDYTIRVHALKSSAAAVGAVELSALAAELEKCGDDGDLDTIKEKTPRLLSDFRDYEKKLAFLAEDEETPEDAEEIPEDKLFEAYDAMAEFLEAFDYDSAEDIQKMLGAFAIPKSEEKRYNKLKEMLATLDRDGALSLLREGRNG